MKRNTKSMKTISLICGLLLLCAPLWGQGPSTGILTASAASCSTSTQNTSACVFLQIPPNVNTVGATVSGTFSATLQFEGTVDNNTWSSIQATPSGGSGVTSTTSAGTWQITPGGFQFIRIRCSAYTSGSATATLNPSNAVTASLSGGGSGSGTVDSGSAYSPAYYPSGGGAVVAGVTPFNGFGYFATTVPPAAATAAQAATLIQGLTGCNTLGYVFTPQASDCVAQSSGGLSGMTQYGLPVAATASTATSSVQPASWTTGHTFVPVWQPSGSALAPTVVDMTYAAALSYTPANCTAGTTGSDCLTLSSGLVPAANLPAALGATTTAHNVEAPLVCADSSGSGTVQSCTTSPSFVPAAGDCVIYTTTTANTGTGLTLNVNSLGAKSVAKWQGTTTLAANDVLANKQIIACYDGTNWELSTIGNAPSALPALPTTVPGVPWTVTSTSSGGVGGAPAWTLPGLSPRTVTGTTSTDVIGNGSGTVTSPGGSTDCGNKVIYEGSVAVASGLPTATALAVPQCAVSLSNNTTGSSTDVTVTPHTWTVNGGATLVIHQNQSYLFEVDPAGTNWLATPSEGAVTVSAPISVTRTALGTAFGVTASGVGATQLAAQYSKGS